MDYVMRCPIFIGWDSRFPEPARVLSYSLRKRASKSLDIRFLDLRHLRECYGFDPDPDPAATTEFTRSRFLVPWLCGYDGWAVFMDNDILCLSDPTEIFRDLDTAEKALYCVQHDHRPQDGSIKMNGAIQTAYPRKNWSSVMLMNCSKLRCWTPRVAAQATPKQLHRFEDIPDSDIGALDPRWNQLDRMDAPTGLLHWTSGMLWNDLTRDWPHQGVWLQARREWLESEGRPPDAPVLSQKM